MEEIKGVQVFDFHNHPFNKGAISRYQLKNLSWDTIEVKPGEKGGFDCLPLFLMFRKEQLEQMYNERNIQKGENIMLMAEQIFNSQSSLTDLNDSKALFITSLIAIEEAYAQTWFIRCILPWISPLNKDIVTAVRKRKITYHSLFKEELEQIRKTKEHKNFEVLKSVRDFNKDELNTILSIEGAHSLQDDFKEPKSILSNLIALKNDATYRFFYLTLTHLTRQPAAVHCFGTQIKKIINLTPNKKYQPDPGEDGISDLGMNIIRTAYENEPYRLLIDIKHMSLRSRQMFYQMRSQEGYEQIPIVATHMGVTGYSYKEAIIQRIKKAPWLSLSKQCDKVLWVPVFNKKTKTRFNPWSINLYDEDIIEILKSKGLIGLNLDQRILGIGKFPYEYMSPEEAKMLRLDCLPKGKDTSAENCDEDFSESWNSAFPVSMNPFFQLNKAQREAERRYMKCANPRHIDYLACNILHIIKVGYRHGFTGKTDGKMDVTAVICIGSDFDGLTDPINLPTKDNAPDHDPLIFVTASKFPKLKTELEYSLNKCLGFDQELAASNINVCELICKVFVNNGVQFLNKHFR